MPEDIAMITNVYISLHPPNYSPTQTRSHSGFLHFLSEIPGSVWKWHCISMLAHVSFLLCQDSVTYPLNKGEHGCVLREINPSVLFVIKAMRG